MRRFALGLGLLLGWPLSAQEALRYRMQVWMRGDGAPLETRFRLQETAAVRSHNRVQKPRMVAWRLEAERSEGTPYAQALLLGRAERLLYLSGPTPQARPEPIALRFGNRSLPVWSLETPRTLPVSVVLVELAPRLLALCDLSARLPKGEVARIELHLEGLDGIGALAPAESGTVLLGTLLGWSRVASQEPGPGPDLVQVQ